MQTQIVYNDLATKVNGILDVSVQLSNYRDKLRAVLPEGVEIHQMAIQIIGRDSGMITSQMGITEKAPLIQINGVSKHWVDKYLRRKKELLLEALQKDKSPLCRKKERWDGNKCEKYCEVKEQCMQEPGWENIPVPVTEVER